MTTYRIRDWNKHFENNRTRDLKELRFVIFPNKHDGDGYTELLDHPNGAAHYGAWCALVQVASKGQHPAGGCGNPAGCCDCRGILLRHGAKPHDSASLARLTRMPAVIFDEVLPRLNQIGWVEIVNGQPRTKSQRTQAHSEITQGGATTSTAESRTPLRKSAVSIEQNGIEQKRREEKEEQETSRASVARDVFSFWRIHLNHPQAIFDAKRGAAIMARLKDGYTSEQLKDAIRGCKLSDFHMGREAGKPGVHDGIQLICKDAEHVDMFIAVTQNGATNGTNKPTSYQTAAERRDATFDRQLAVVNELRSRSSGTVDEVLRGKPS